MQVLTLTLLLMYHYHQYVVNKMIYTFAGKIVIRFSQVSRCYIKNITIKYLRCVMLIFSAFIEKQCSLKSSPAPPVMDLDKFHKHSPTIRHGRVCRSFGLYSLFRKQINFRAIFHQAFFKKIGLARDVFMILLFLSHNFC